MLFFVNFFAADFVWKKKDCQNFMRNRKIDTFFFDHIFFSATNPHPDELSQKLQPIRMRIGCRENMMVKKGEDFGSSLPRINSIDPVFFCDQIDSKILFVRGRTM